MCYECNKRITYLVNLELKGGVISGISKSNLDWLYKYSSEKVELNGNASGWLSPINLHWFQKSSMCI